MSPERDGPVTSTTLVGGPSGQCSSRWRRRSPVVGHDVGRGQHEDGDAREEADQPAVAVAVDHDAAGGRDGGGGFDHPADRGGRRAQPAARPHQHLAVVGIAGAESVPDPLVDEDRTPAGDDLGDGGADPLGRSCGGRGHRGPRRTGPSGRPSDAAASGQTGRTSGGRSTGASGRWGGGAPGPAAVRSRRRKTSLVAASREVPALGPLAGPAGQPRPTAGQAPAQPAELRGGREPGPGAPEPRPAGEAEAPDAARVRAGVAPAQLEQQVVQRDADRADLPARPAQRRGLGQLPRRRVLLVEQRREDGADRARRTPTRRRGRRPGGRRGRR